MRLLSTGHSRTVGPLESTRRMTVRSYTRRRLVDGPNSAAAVGDVGDLSVGGALGGSR